MHRKENIKVTLLTAFFCLALGGWVLHLRIHPIARNIDYIIPFISGIISVFCLPILFCFRPTIALAYIFNGFLVILGTITMADLSISHFEGPVTLGNIIMNTTFADIALLWGKFSIGKALFDLDRLKSDTESTPKGRFWRYPNMGWWWVHLLGLSIIYALGNIIWKRG
jgi:hypothetical protein